MEDAKIEFNCPGCENSISFPVTDAGTIQECQHCGGYVDVPGGSDSVLPNDTDYDRQIEDYNRQTEETRRQLEVSKIQQEEYGRQLSKDADLQNQHSSLIDKWNQTVDDVNALVAKWNTLAEQFESYISSREKDDRK